MSAQDGISTAETMLAAGLSSGGAVWMVIKIQFKLLHDLIKENKQASELGIKDAKETAIRAHHRIDNHLEKANGQ